MFSKYKKPNAGASKAAANAPKLTPVPSAPAEPARQSLMRAMRAKAAEAVNADQDKRRKVR